MIILTGAAGFIGSNLLTGLNDRRYKDIVLVDDFSNARKAGNYQGKQFREMVERHEFSNWMKQHNEQVQMVIHLGARTDTTEFNWNTFLELNVDYSKTVWNLCVEFGIPLIYASSAATYGLGEQGYSDDHDLVGSLKPLNPYGRSKNEFDKWALNQVRKPFFWAGLKFFNVYGPNEYHKDQMASVVLHAFRQIGETGTMKLFRSHRPDFSDGEQLRDFIYVKDVVDVIMFLMEERPRSGIFNVGTGQASSFNRLVRATFAAMDKEPAIEYIDTPENIRERYQYYTEAVVDKLRETGYDQPFTTLEDGVHDYVRTYLINDRMA
jgi:ADP-L-glycero-D-manno-heptose 6-epimerase